jgi:hypothetical protein
LKSGEKRTKWQNKMNSEEKQKESLRRERSEAQEENVKRRELGGGKQFLLQPSQAWHFIQSTPEGFPIPIQSLHTLQSSPTSEG